MNRAATLDLFIFCNDRFPHSNWELFMFALTWEISLPGGDYVPAVAGKGFSIN